jgi:hypothetical protein
VWDLDTTPVTVLPTSPNVLQNTSSNLNFVTITGFQVGALVLTWIGNNTWFRR